LKTKNPGVSKTSGVSNFKRQTFSAQECHLFHGFKRGIIGARQETIDINSRYDFIAGGIAAIPKDGVIPGRFWLIRQRADGLSVLK
jgi:hypothetical protein